MSDGYESFFGLDERPFSLTPDPKYFFKSRSHGRAIETLTFGLRSREPFLFVSGDIGVGKTLLCRTLLEQLRRRGLASFISNPFLSPGALVRLLLDDFGTFSGEHARRGHVAGATLDELLELLVEVLRFRRDAAVVVVDNAQDLPSAVAQQLLSLSSLHTETDQDKLLQVVFVGQSPRRKPQGLGTGALHPRLSTTIRLLPFGRDETATYVAHRVTVAGGSSVAFTPRAIDLVYALSGGVPRLINLLCERALQEAAGAGVRNIEPVQIDAAASALQLSRARRRRFRWFAKRVS